MKVIEENIFYTLLKNGKLDIHSPIWKQEHTGVNYAMKIADEYSWRKTPITNREFKPIEFKVVEIDTTKLRPVFKIESKDFRKKRKSHDKES